MINRPDDDIDASSMNLPLAALTFDNSKAVYRQVTGQVRELILNAALEAGERLTRASE